MNTKLVKILTSDNLELTGILYYPICETKQVVVHVHGLAGNFYENSFIDYQAKEYVDKGFAYFVFNNRGNNYLTELIKREDNKVSYVFGGSAYESFVDSYYDIDAAIKYLFDCGYNEITLQGHSYGCNKVVYYYLKNSNNIKNIILLAPCDLVAETKSFNSNYDEHLKKNKELYDIGKMDELVYSNEFPPLVFSVKTFIEDWIENSKSDIFRYRVNGYINSDLKNINIPVLVQIGNNDGAALVVDKELVTKYLNENINDLTLNYIDDANHGYIGKEQEMATNCVEWLMR